MNHGKYQTHNQLSDDKIEGETVELNNTIYWIDEVCAKRNNQRDGYLQYRLIFTFLFSIEIFLV